MIDIVKELQLEIRHYKKQIRDLNIVIKHYQRNVLSTKNKNLTHAVRMINKSQEERQLIVALLMTKKLTISQIAYYMRTTKNKVYPMISRLREQNCIQSYVSSNITKHGKKYLKIFAIGDEAQ